MLYPEMPKSKKRTSYITAGIFALLVGIVIFLLFLPGFLNYSFGFKPWDWNTIIPDLNSDFFAGVGYYLKLALPVILFLCAISSLFMGMSKSGGLFKGSIIASTLALILKDSLEPANLTTSMKGTLAYIEYALIGIALVLAVLGTVFRFIGEEPYVPFRANSFHFFASYALIVIITFYLLLPMIGSALLVANTSFYFGTVFGLFLVVAAIWLFCTSTRDPSEFGVGYEREAKNIAEHKKAEQQAKQTTSQEAPQPTPVGATQAPPKLGPDGKPLPPMPPRPQTSVPPKAPTPQAQQTTTGASQNIPPKPMSPTGKPLPPRPPMPPKLGPDGKPLPPMPPRSQTSVPPKVAPQPQANPQTKKDEGK